MFSTIISLALAASTVFAAPAFPAAPAGLPFPTPGKLTCSISTAKMTLPAGQTALSAPTDPISSVILGVGIQNYTCTDAGTYASAGAVADLYDLSCLTKLGPIFNGVQDLAFAAWKIMPASIKTPGRTPLMGYGFLGSHFFVTSPSGTGISPVWDYRAGSAKGNSNAFVLAAKVGNTPAPTGKQDVDWLQLKSVQGSLATQIYRTDTRGGQPPASCKPGSAPISVKYVSKYWLFGGSVNV
ncbi:hypothetical protein JR316_0007929 [Psilocybe cubensis]|uniref:Uncharacterized protein n=2 Tax=Psilocybe cubensis TaxID=181762 RepID=A0ACB8GV50_PSICU|nr:hypothetical protein JR316_0007929 [Psilocybe cubensis]KAH9479339.1 hypothetical protein JR316_0007929 [Psilocybe cubensis]